MARFGARPLSASCGTSARRRSAIGDLQRRRQRRQRVPPVRGGGRGVRRRRGRRLRGCSERCRTTSPPVPVRRPHVNSAALPGSATGAVGRGLSPTGRGLLFGGGPYAPCPRLCGGVDTGETGGGRPVQARDRETGAGAPTLGPAGRRRCQVCWGPRRASLRECPRRGCCASIPRCGRTSSRAGRGRVGRLNALAAAERARCGGAASKSDDVDLLVPVPPWARQLARHSVRGGSGRRDHGRHWSPAACVSSSAALRRARHTDRCWTEFGASHGRGARRPADGDLVPPLALTGFSSVGCLDRRGRPLARVDPGTGRVRDQRAWAGSWRRWASDGGRCVVGRRGWWRRQSRWNCFHRQGGWAVVRGRDGSRPQFVAVAGARLDRRQREGGLLTEAALWRTGGTGLAQAPHVRQRSWPRHSSASRPRENGYGQRTPRADARRTTAPSSAKRRRPWPPDDPRRLRCPPGVDHLGRDDPYRSA
jgi:hypothetical protein